MKKAPSDSPIWQLKKRELLLSLSFLITKPILISLYVFEGSAFTFQFLNDRNHNVFFSLICRLLDFWSLNMILESTKEDFFLAKNTFNEIDEKTSAHKMHCMACTAPDATKTDKKIDPQ